MLRAAQERAARLAALAAAEKPPGPLQAPLARARAPLEEAYLRSSAVFRDTLRVFSRRPVEFIVPFAAVGVGLFVSAILMAMAVIGPVVADPTAVPSLGIEAFLGPFLVYAVVFFLVATILQGAFAHFAIHRHRGRKPSLLDSFQIGVEKLPSVALAILLFTGIVGSMFLVPMATFSVGTTTGNRALAAVGFLGSLVGTIAGLYTYVGLSLFGPSIVIEDSSAVRALRRSWRLTEGKRWPLFLAYFVINVIASLFLVGIRYALPTSLALEFPSAPHFALLGLVVGYAVASSLLVIATAVAYSLIVFPSARPAAPAEPSPAPSGPAAGP